MTIAELNRLAPAQAEAELLRCCGSRRWAETLATSRPFDDRASLLERADSVWSGLSDSDWLEAFSHHPKIGAKSGDTNAPRARFASTSQWASDEQKGAAQASEEVLTRLAERNVAYERRFGYIFIVCATGKTAAEMLALLEARLDNLPEQELRIAAGEQAKITRIRLEKLLS